jgi:hypothetical protein
MTKEEMKFHEVADIFPRMTDAELYVLAADIKQHGLQESIKRLGAFYSLSDGDRQKLVKWAIGQLSRSDRQQLVLWVEQGMPGDD